eukprot:SAG22_NODE_5835_length_945_cov_1.947991_1_plen_63_part_00
MADPSGGGGGGGGGEWQTVGRRSSGGGRAGAGGFKLFNGRCGPHWRVPSDHLPVGCQLAVRG